MDGPRLYVAISPHGFGHLSLLAPILGATRRRLRGLQLTIETPFPRALVARRVDEPFGLAPETEDFGLVMRDPITADMERSASRYRALHADWSGVVARAAARISASGADVVLSSAGYIAPAAARSLGLRALVISPLNWRQIYARYFCDRPGAEGVLETITASYEAAEALLAPEGGPPETTLANAVGVGPIGSRGRLRRAALRARIGARPGERLALVSFGGVEAAPMIPCWPRDRGWRWLTRGAAAADHPDAVDIGSLPEFSFADLVASVDAVVTKLGYGMAMEAGFAGTPTLYLPRGDDWIEEPYLRAWLARHAPLAAVDADRLRVGEHVQALDALAAVPAPGPPARPTGVAPCVERLAALF